MITWLIWFGVMCLFFAGDYLRKDIFFSKYREAFFYDLMVLVAILFAGLRYKVGNDYDNYALVYEAIRTNPLNTYMEPGYAYFCYLLNILGLSFQGMFFLFATVTILLISRTIKKYSVHPALSFMIFLLVPFYYFNVLCIVRQFFAMAVVFACLPYIIERKFWKFFFCVLIVTSFHKSAIAIVPFYFIAPLRINKFLMLGALAAVILYPPAQLLNHLVLLNDYDEYLVSKPPEFGIGLTLIFRVLVFIFVLFSREKHETKSDAYITNLYLVGVIFYFATLSTEALSRISLYLTILDIIVVVNTFYLYTRTGRIKMALVYITYCALAFFQNLHSYGGLYNKGTSEGNINYSVNFKLFH